MAKTIDDYKKDYAEARARGDAAGMQAANDGANAIRRSQGVAEERADVDIAKFKNSGTSTGGTTSKKTSGLNYTSTGGTAVSKTGSGSTGGSKSGSSGGSKGSSLPYGLDDYGQKDWSVSIMDRIRAGDTWQNVFADLTERNKKIAGDPSLSRYEDDAIAQAADDYIKMMQQQEAMAQAPIYSGRYDRDIDQETDQFRRMSYEDWVNSDAYKSLAARYGHLAGIGMDDMLGKLAARTGGLASSYAVSAAQQQYNEYMGRLEEVARQMYDADRDDLLENIGLLQDLDQRDYNRYLGALSQYNTDRNFQYQAGLDRWKQDYQLGRDQINDSRYDQEYADGRLDADKNDAQSRIDAFLAAGGSATDLDPGLVEQSGYTQVELAALERYYAQQAQAVVSKGSSSGRGSGSGSGGSESGDKAGTLYDYDGLFRAAKESGNPNSFISNHYKEYGFTSSSGLTTDYKNWVENASEDDSIPINYGSVNALGYGPISNDTLWGLVESGEVEPYEQNGEWYFRRIRSGSESGGNGLLGLLGGRW